MKASFCVPRLRSSLGTAASFMGAILIANSFCTGAQSQTAQAPGTVTQYTMPTRASLPCAIDYGPDGQMWIEGLVDHSLTRYNAATASFEQFNLPNTLTVPALTENGILPGLSQYPALNALLQGVAGILQLLTGKNVTLPLSLQCGINNGPDGNIWFNDLAANIIGNINPYTHVVSSYPLPPLTIAWDLNGGPDNAIWYVTAPPAAIGRFDLTTQAFTTYPLPNPSSLPIGIFPASDGGMWFPEILGNKIGRIDVVTKQITEYPVPTPLALPFVLRAETPDGSLWFTEFAGNKIGRVTMRTGAITEYPLPKALSGPISVTLGFDGNIYSDLSLVNQIARLVPSTGLITTKSIPAIPGAFPDEIRAGTDKDIWFTELVSNKFGRITPF